MTYDASDPKQVREAERALRRGDAGSDKMLDAVMGLPQGRAWIWELLSFCGTARSVFDRNGLTMAMLAGQQNVGHMVMAQILRVCLTSI